ncbi:MAG: response regulator [Bacteroidetes bacterium]|jgi:response regulator of citrate/malate metabolism|nr:response regulator [Bacteroidota bacterium]
MIYLIDDDEIQNLINTRVISIVADNIPVQAFTSAESALKMLEENSGTQPEMIFLDINMPKMNGWDFLDAYNKFEQKVRVYMLSSSINNKDIQKSETYDIVHGFICKPLVVERLSEILQAEGMV